MLNTPLPCGKCPACLQRRATSWAFRLAQEDRVSGGGLFVTLTYDMSHVNLSDSGWMTLCKRDFQLFMKRYRKLHPVGTQIKYYAVGEYGSTNLRPHFHAIMFGCDKELLPQAWDIGLIHVGNITGASIAYTCKYINKGKIVPIHRNDDRVPEFSLMSKNLGLSYLTPQIIDYHAADLSRSYVTLEGGVKAALPRYFRDRIYSTSEREEQADLIRVSANKKSGITYDDYIRKGGTPSGYSDFLNQRRQAAVVNFKSKSLNSRKL